MYFSLVAFTTLGFGDVVLDPSWQLLSAIEAANGIMIFGWTTALIFWFPQRTVQRAHHERGTALVINDVASEILPYRTSDEP